MPYHLPTMLVCHNNCKPCFNKIHHDVTTSHFWFCVSKCTSFCCWSCDENIQDKKSIFWRLKKELWTIFRMGHFGAAQGWWGESPLLKICHTCLTMMKLYITYLKKLKNIYKLRDRFLEFCWHQHFFKGNLQLLLYQKIQIKIAF